MWKVNTRPTRASDFFDLSLVGHIYFIEAFFGSIQDGVQEGG
jgi:hypothetical protein